MATLTRTLTTLAVCTACAIGGALLSSSAPARPITDPPVRIAMCDVVLIAGRLMDTDQYAKPLAEKRRSLAESLVPLEREVEAIGKQLQALGPNATGPEAQALARQFNDKRQQYSQQAQVLDRQYDAFRSQINFEAYKQVLAAADAIGERRGYTMVIASRRLDDGRAPDNAMSFLQGVLARPVVRIPKADDITDAVAAEVKLPETPAPGATAPAPAAPTAPPAGRP